VNLVMRQQLPQTKYDLRKPKVAQRLI